MEGFEYEEYYWDTTKRLVTNLLVISYLWFIGLSFDEERAKKYV